MADLTVSFTKPAITTRYLITTNIETDVETLKSDVNTLQTETATNTNDISTLSSTVSSQGTTLTSLSSQVQTNTSDISSLKTFENEINTTIDNRVKTDLTTTYTNSDYESMTGLKNWIESKGGDDGLTMDDLETNLLYPDDTRKIKDFMITTASDGYEFDTRKAKLIPGEYLQKFNSKYVRRVLISFYKRNNKITGFCIFQIYWYEPETYFIDNAGNNMSLYNLYSIRSEQDYSRFTLLDELGNKLSKYFVFMAYNTSWNYINVFFDEKFSNTILKAFFGDNVSVDDIQCTNENDYLRINYTGTGERGKPMMYNIPYTIGPFLKNQTKSFLTSDFKTSDFESMTNLKAWIQSLITTQINNQN